MYPRNAAFPPRIAIGPVVQISDGAVQTSGVSIKVRPEGGSASAGGGATAYEEGIVLYTPTQAETDYTAFIVIAFKTGCIPATATVVTTAATTAGKASLDADQAVNVTKWGGTAVALAYVQADAAKLGGQPVTAAGAITAGAYIGNATAALMVNASGHVTLADASIVTAKLGTFALAKTTNITGFNDIAATSIVSGGAITTSGGNITGTVGGIAGTVTTLDGVLSGLATAHGAGSWATATGFSTHSAADVVTALGTGTTLTALATASVLATVATYVDTEVAAIKTVTDKLDTALELDGAVYRYTTNALEQSPTGSGGFTSDDRTKLEGILEDTGTTLPGTLATIAGYLDSEIALILGYVDCLPASWVTVPTAEAVASQVRTELSTELARIDVAVTTRQATVTNLGTLVTDWTDGGRLDLLLDQAAAGGGLDAAGVRAAIGLASANLDTQLSTIAGYVDTEIGLIKTVTDKVGTMVELDGAVYRFTENSLEEGPTGGSVAAADVWAYATRTLTSSPATIAAIVAGSTLTMHRGDTLSISLTGLGNISARSKLWFAVKKTADQLDADAQLHVEETAGLLRVNGSAPVTGQTGTITVTNPTTGAVTITISAAASAAMWAGKGVWDLQMKTSAGVVTTLTNGVAVIAKDVSRITS